MLPPSSRVRPRQPLSRAALPFAGAAALALLASAGCGKGADPSGSAPPAGVSGAPAGGAQPAPATSQGAGAILQVAAGGTHNCVVLKGGVVKCWGRNQYGELGAGDTANRGANPGDMAKLVAVDLGKGRSAKSLGLGYQHSCAVLDDGSVKCWGKNEDGQLGLGDTAHRGDAAGEMGDKLPAVDLGKGRTAKMVAAGYSSTCALLDNGSVKCWGKGDDGQLGIGSADHRGKSAGTMGDSLPAVDLGKGRTAVSVTVSIFNACALLDDGTVKCWGVNDEGQLGLGDKVNHGDKPGTMGDQLPATDLGKGRTARFVQAASQHACALLDTGSVKCWGKNDGGRLGLGDDKIRGDAPGQMGDNLPVSDLGKGRTVKAMSLADHHRCAILDDDTVKCWGLNNWGQLGLGDRDDRGDAPGEMGDKLPVVDLGKGKPVALAAGGIHTCALFESGALKCWGAGEFGALGTETRDDHGTSPGQMGDALPEVPIR